jgi:hypothetical protein
MADSTFFGTLQGEPTVQTAPVKTTSSLLRPPAPTTAQGGPRPAVAPPSPSFAAAVAGVGAAVPSDVAAEGGGQRNVLEALRVRAAKYFHKRDVGQEMLGLFALMLSAACGFVFVAGNFGIAAVFGLLSLLLGTLVVVPASWTPRSLPIVDGIVPLGDLCIAGGLLAGVARSYPGVVVGLALVVAVLLAWLPFVKAKSAMIPTEAGLWRRTDRLCVLLFGALIGRPIPAMIFVAAAAGFDAWLRMERLDVPGPGKKPRPASRLITADGTFAHPFRWVTLALAIGLLFVFPLEDAWVF